MGLCTVKKGKGACKIYGKCYPFGSQPLVDSFSECVLTLVLVRLRVCFLLPGLPRGRQETKALNNSSSHKPQSYIRFIKRRGSDTTGRVDCASFVVIWTCAGMSHAIAELDTINMSAESYTNLFRSMTLGPGCYAAYFLFLALFLGIKQTPSVFSLPVYDNMIPHLRPTL